jgi:predicted SprT family Zn-dependent metalloprotease
MRDKIKTLHEIRTKWSELAQNVYDRFKVRVGMPKQIYYVENRGFLARVWTLPTSVEKLEINSKCLLPENWDYFVKTTLTHEFAHAFNRAKGNEDSHGDGWKLCMRLLGVYPSRCGEWPSDAAKRNTNNNKNPLNNGQTGSNNPRQSGMRPVCSDRNLIDLGDY